MAIATPPIAANSASSAPPTPLALPPAEAPETPVRRRELAAFLRTRRERLAPEDAGLVAGGRRRTPGLRREEVAQLANVGVTWYTWLEQGRPIHASAEVLEAIARALRLDAPEREHLFRLAGVTPTVVEPVVPCLEREVQIVLDQLYPLPACVMNSRYDVLAWNGAYGALFPGLVDAPPAERNLLWQVFGAQAECPVFDREPELARLVATLRGAFSRHIGEPAWTEFVRQLSVASPEFASLWARHDVAEPANRLKRFRGMAGEPIDLWVTGFGVTGTPEARMVVYTPIDATAAERLSRQQAARMPLSRRFEKETEPSRR
jgi:transcriptional regulator with XRE-family HTH domain